MQLNKFKNELRDNVLQILWDQWSSLGLAGYVSSKSIQVIDPEALTIFSAAAARYDQRLFDEILDWLILNERFINVQRMKAILKKENFNSEKVINAIAGYIFSFKSGLKWKTLAEKKNTDKEEKLFYLHTGKPMPVGEKKDLIFQKYGFERNPVKLRAMSNHFPAKTAPGLLLQIRGLMGVNSRSEILLYLLLNQKGTIQEIANHTYYSWRSVQDVLFEMGYSSVVYFPETKKGRIYYINPKPWLKILLNTSQFKISWISWVPLFRALEIIWLKITEPVFSNLSEIEQAAELKLLTDKELIHRFEKAGFGSHLNILNNVWGEEYLNKWILCINSILTEVSKAVI